MNGDAHSRILSMSSNAANIHRLQQPSSGYGMEGCAANHGLNLRWTIFVARKAPARPDEIVIG